MSTARLLILDDDPALLAMMEMMAEGCGFSTRGTPDFTEFFRLIEEWRPSLIVLDLLMPGMNGLSVLSQLARHGSNTRVIIISGQGGEALEEARRVASQIGITIAATLSKPFSLSAFRSLLASES